MAFSLPNIQNIVSTFLGLNYGIQQLRTIEWGKNYLWAVRFIEPKPPSPFNDFFPASSIELPQAVLDTFGFNLDQSTYKIPKNTSAKDISITFYDDDKSVLSRWIEEW